MSSNNDGYVRNLDRPLSFCIESWEPAHMIVACHSLASNLVNLVPMGSYFLPETEEEIGLSC